MENKPEGIEENVAHAESEDEINAAPTGAFLFVLVMILGYIVYYASLYIEVFIARGA